VTDANSTTATASFSLTVNGALMATAVISSESLTVNQTVTAFVPVVTTGGTAPLSYSVSPALPAGLTMASTTGAITGTPTVASAVGTYTVTVTDANKATATASFTLIEIVLDFTFAGVGAGESAVIPGQASEYPFALSPLYGSYAGKTSFTVTGLPAGAVASFTPSSVAANAGPTTVQMTVQTSATVGRNIQGPIGRSLDAGAALALLFLPFVGRPKTRQRLQARVVLGLLLLGGSMAAITGCGANSNGFLSQAQKTYTLTVTATSGSLAHSQTVMLTVQ
jgi:hypothetical protein